ncbi:hypothetical protein [Natrinema halophilum]|uniref:Uncharacterized protein n=1 Tax=Natrinema halophilum TaxID=1699371 RepID=A0A7D5KT64_9EURY|nr:hypothetical protein [Natrinema halophilum]QLG51037.1 hypothetical protein HYG82_20485 [Natrinema halophilum]
MSDVAAVVVLAGILSRIGLERTETATNLLLFVFVQSAVDVVSGPTGIDVTIDPGIAEVAFCSIVVTRGIVQVRDGGWGGGWVPASIGCWLCRDGVDEWRTESGGGPPSTKWSRRERRSNSPGEYSKFSARPTVRLPLGRAVTDPYSSALLKVTLRNVTFE